MRSVIMAESVPGPSRLLSADEALSMFERDSFYDLDASSSSGDEVMDLSDPDLLAQVVP